MDGRRAIESVKARFHEAHETAYGYADRNAPVEFVNVRLVALGPETELLLHPVATAPNSASTTADDATARHGIAEVGSRDVWFRDADRSVVTSILDRTRLPRADPQIDGPAVIEQTNSTTLVIPGWTATIDAQANLLLEPTRTGDRWNSTARNDNARRGLERRREQSERHNLQIILGRLDAVCQEMQGALVRSAYSVNIKERLDCSTAVFDRNGDVVAMPGDSTHPIHLSS